MTGATFDCEQIIDGFLRQPANAVTSLAFVVAGAVVATRSERRWVAGALAATGVGSFLFHGPMPPGAQWGHDVSLAWLLVVAGASGTRWERWAGWPALAAVAAVIWLAPDMADPVAALASAGAIAAILWRHRTKRTWFSLGMLTVAAIVGRLSASEGPWCRPDSLLQGHSFWHLAAATAVTVWATERPVTVLEDVTV